MNKRPERHKPKHSEWVRIQVLTRKLGLRVIIVFEIIAYIQHQYRGERSTRIGMGSFSPPEGPQSRFWFSVSSIFNKEKCNIISLGR